MIFDDFYYLKLKFELTALAETKLPKYLGSTIRGVIGHGLKTACCIEKNHDIECINCKYYRECPYTKIFHGIKAKELASGKRIPIPNPYVINPEKSKIIYKKGDKLSFDIIMFGDSVNYFEYFLFAVNNIYNKGLGYKRTKFKMTKVINTENNETVAINDRVVTRKPKLSIFNYNPIDMKVIKIKFITNLRLKNKNRFVNEMSFFMLINAILRRAEYLNNNYYGINYSYNKYEILEAAKKVETLDSNLEWEKRERYSNRQSGKKSIGGLKGTIAFMLDTDMFDEILRLGELINIGSLTTMGLGKYIVV